MQKEYGKVSLETYLNNRPRGRGSGEPFTPEVYGSFITGIIPEDYGVLKRGFDKEYPTIFTFAPLDRWGVSTALSMDVPTYGGYLGHSWMEEISGFPLFVRYWREKIPLKIVEHEHYKYMDIKTSYAELINMLDYDLVMFYFKEPDKLQHIWDLRTQEPKFRKLYRKCEDITEHIINGFSDKETLFIVFSDHGTTPQGWHSQYGFWSSNKSLARGEGDENSIDLVDWFNIIKEWYEK